MSINSCGGLGSFFYDESNVNPWTVSGLEKLMFGEEIFNIANSEKSNNSHDDQNEGTHQNNISGTIPEK